MTGDVARQVEPRDPGERNFQLPLAALALLLGIWLGAHTQPGLWVLWLALVALALAVALRALRLPWLGALLPVVLAVGLCLTWAWLEQPAPAPGEYGTITATVYGDAVERSGGRVAVVLCNLTLDGAPQPGRAYCTLYPEGGVTAASLYDGASLRFSGRVYRPWNKQNEEDFDFRLWLLQNGIGSGVTGVEHLAVLNTPATAPWADPAARIRAAVRTRLQAALGDAAPLALAMLLGDRGSLQDADQAAFQQAGVAHLMSVSGLHVGLLAAVLLALLRALTVRKGLRLPLLAGFLLLYCGATGLSAATVRASVMLLLVQGAQVAGRKPQALTTLSAAAIVVLLLNPLQLFSAGFALSFGAMAGILLLYPRFQALLERDARKEVRGGAFRRLARRRMGTPGEALGISLSAQVGVLLPTAAAFHQLPLYGLVFNVLAVPLAGLLVPLIAFTLLLACLPLVGGSLAYACGIPTAAGLRLLQGLVNLVTRLPFAQVRVAEPSVWIYAALLAAVLASSRVVRAPLRARLLAGSLCVTVALTVAVATAPATVRYHQFAVGQGDSALLVDGATTVAIDAGPYGGELAGRLLAEGRDLDALLLTHLHRDHVQGLQTLLDDGIAIRRIYLPEGAFTVEPDAETSAMQALITQSGIPVTFLTAGDSLAFAHTRIDILWPSAGSARPGIGANDRSLVTRIRLEGLRILSMGDNGALYEAYAALPCDVLKVGHHGSNGGTTDAFLSLTDPALAIITCEADAPLPGTDTLTRLAAHGTQVLRTDRAGEICIAAEGNRYTVSTYLTGGQDEP